LLHIVYELLHVVVQIGAEPLFNYAEVQRVLDDLVVVRQVLEFTVNRLMKYLGVRHPP
jgi:hypothetical protein